MLAQNFKTAAELGITDYEQQVLIKVLGMFERSEVVPVTNRYEPKVPNGFHMGCVSTKNRCGTAACIKGWAQIIADDDGLFRTWDSADRMPQGKYEALFDGLFMYGDDRRLTLNDPAQAALALRSYLTTGDARWDLALAD